MSTDKIVIVLKDGRLRAFTSEEHPPDRGIVLIDFDNIENDDRLEDCYMVPRSSDASDPALVGEMPISRLPDFAEAFVAKFIWAINEGECCWQCGDKLPAVEVLDRTELDGPPYCVLCSGPW